MDPRWAPLLTCVMMLFFLVGNQIDFLGTKIGEQGSNTFGLSENKTIIFSTFDICQGPLSCAQKSCSIFSSSEVVMGCLQPNLKMICPKNLSEAFFLYDQFVPYSGIFSLCVCWLVALFIFVLFQVIYILRRKESSWIPEIQFGIVVAILLSLLERNMSLDQQPQYISNSYYIFSLLGTAIFIIQSVMGYKKE
jgi:hypothetical protein